ALSERRLRTVAHADGVQQRQHCYVGVNRTLVEQLIAEVLGLFLRQPIPVVDLLDQGRDSLILCQCGRTGEQGRSQDGRSENGLHFACSSCAGAIFCDIASDCGGSPRLCSPFERCIIPPFPACRYAVCAKMQMLRRSERSLASRSVFASRREGTATGWRWP